VALLVTFPSLPFFFLKFFGRIDNDFFILKKRNKINNFFVIFVMIFYLEKKVITNL